MSRLGLCLLVGLLAQQGAQPSPVFLGILRSSGLGDLSPTQMAKVEDLLAGMSKASTAAIAKNAELYTSAATFLKNQGYAEARVVIGRVGPRWALVDLGDGPFQRKQTTDLPIDFDPNSFHDGWHLVKRTALGDISDLIADGKSYSFQFSTWR